MMEKIEKLKQGKIDPNELLKSITKESPQSIGVIHSDTKPNHTSVNNNSRIGVATQKAASVSKEPRRVEKTEPSRKTEEEAKK